MKHRLWLASAAVAAAVATPAAAQEAIVDTAKPFAAGAQEIEQYLRGPVGWPTFQEGRAGDLFFRFNPDGFARFGQGERLDAEYWEVECTPRPVDCSARRGPVRLSVGEDGRPSISLDGVASAERFSLTGDAEDAATLPALSAPDRTVELLAASSLTPLEDGDILPIDGLATVAAFIRWVENGQAADLAFDAAPRRPFANPPKAAAGAKPAPAAPSQTSSTSTASGSASSAPLQEGTAGPAAAAAQANDGATPSVPPTGSMRGPTAALAAEQVPPQETGPTVPAGQIALQVAGAASVEPAAPPPPAAAASPVRPPPQEPAAAPAQPAPAKASGSAPKAAAGAPKAAAAAPKASAAAPKAAAAAPKASAAAPKAVAAAPTAVAAAPKSAAAPKASAATAQSTPAASPADTISRAACEPIRIAPGDIQEPIDSLRGLPGVFVIVDYLVEPPSAKGKLRSGVLEAIRSRFDAAGIRLLSKEEVQDTPGRPQLEFYLTPGDANKGCVFRVWISLRQEVALVRDTSIHLLTGTWGDGGVARPSDSPNGPELDTFIYYIERFVSAYQKANSAAPAASTAPASASPEPAPAGPSGKDLLLSLQELLQEAGYDPGPIDGQMGPRTQAAIRAFEGGHDLPVTGQPSQAVLDRLRSRRAEGPG